MQFKRSSVLKITKQNTLPLLECTYNPASEDRQPGRALGMEVSEASERVMDKHL